MTGGLSFLAVGLLTGAAIAWVLPGLPHLRHSVDAQAAPQPEKPLGEPVPGAGPKDDQPRLVKLDADDAARVRDDGAGDDDGDERGSGRPGKPRSQNFWGRIAMVSWADLFESKGFGACFGGLVSVLTLQMAGVNAPSAFALTLLIVVGYWLAFDKPR